MNLARAALACLMIIGTLYYIFSTWAMLRHFRSARPHTLRRRFAVSILKPVCGADPHLRSNLASYLNQFHTCSEVLFGVLDPADPALPLLRRLAKSHANASLYTGSDIDGANNKVRILHTLAGHARGEILLITDADTCAEPGFIGHITPPFADPKVGAVTCMYKGVGPRSVGDVLEAMHMTCIFAPGVASHNALAGIDFGLGAAIAVRAEILDRAGGFRALADYLADDFQLGRIVSKTGSRVVLSTEVIGITMGAERLLRVLEREIRWLVTTRISRPWGHLGLVFTFGSAYAMAHLAASGFSAPGWLALAAVMLIRFTTAYLGAYICMGDKDFPRHAHLLPLRDVLSFGTWLASFVVRSVKWRGRNLKLTKHGKVAP